MPRRAKRHAQLLSPAPQVETPVVDLKTKRVWVLTCESREFLGLAGDTPCRTEDTRKPAKLFFLGTAAEDAKNDQGYLDTFFVRKDDTWVEVMLSDPPKEVRYEVRFKVNPGRLALDLEREIRTQLVYSIGDVEGSLEVKLLSEHLDPETRAVSR